MAIVDIREKIDGYHGKYIDNHGNSCKVKGTWALGPYLSWHTEQGDWVEIDGANQGFEVPELIRVEVQ